MTQFNRDLFQAELKSLLLKHNVQLIGADIQGDTHGLCTKFVIHHTDGAHNNVEIVLDSDDPYVYTSDLQCKYFYPKTLAPYSNSCIIYDMVSNPAYHTTEAYSMYVFSFTNVHDDHIQQSLLAFAKWLVTEEVDDDENIVELYFNFDEAGAEELASAIGDNELFGGYWLVGEHAVGDSVMGQDAL